MSKKNYKVAYTLKSNYSIQKKHKKLPNGNTIYYRDYMVTNGNSSFHNSMPYGESNFKMVTPTEIDETRLHDTGSYILDEEGNSGWTLNSVSGTTENNVNKIEINPNFSDFRDLIYYGSCYETVKNSILDIINKFPGEMYVTDIPLIGNSGEYPSMEYYQSDIDYIYQQYNVSINDFAYIDNPFNIDIVSSTISVDENGIDRTTGYEPNEDRYFCKSIKKYVIFNNETETTDFIHYNAYKDWEVYDYWNERIVPYLTEYQYRYQKGCKNNRLISIITVHNDYNPYGDSDNSPIDGVYNENTSFVIFRFYINGKYVLACDKEFIGTHIRLNNSYIEEFYNNLSNVQKMILNRKTNYSLRLKVPVETEHGLVVRMEDWQFPVSNRGNWNIDIEGNGYTESLKRILDIAEIYDEYYTNNLWGRMVHDSIKNMDLTFTNEKDGEDSEDFKIGLSKMEELMYSYGVFFDELKSYIDNVKSVNKVSLNGYNNVPDYLLTDVTTNSGWDTFDPTTSFISATTTDVLYSGTSKEYTVNDVYVNFFRILKMSTKSILTRKGTKASIEMLMGLFGLKSYDFARNYYNCLPFKFKKFTYDKWDIFRTSDIKEDSSIVDIVFKNEEENYYYAYVYDDGKYFVKTKVDVIWDFDDLDDDEQREFYDYKIDEYVCVAHPKGDDIVDYTYEIDEDAPIEIYNTWKGNFDNYDEDKLNGLPVNTATFDEEEIIDGSATTITYKYFIPWFDKSKTYDGDLYFQMNGGWCKTKSVDVNSQLVEKYKLETATIFEEEENGYPLYKETVKNIIVAGDVYSLKILGNKLSEGSIVKVTSSYIKGGILDTFDFSEEMSGYTEYENFSARTEDDFSSYFYLENVEDGHFKDYFYIEDGELKNGWVNVPLSDIKNKTGYGINVLYMENITDNAVGNNPHNGNGYYDDGKEYIEYLQQNFKYSIENDNFDANAYDCNTGEVISGITNVGFDNLLTEDESGNTMVKYILDNQKCWYFSDEIETDESGLTLLNSSFVNYIDTENDLNNNIVGEMVEDNSLKEVGLNYTKNDNFYGFYKADLKPYDFIDKEEGSHSEASADSIINTKKIKLSFTDNIYSSTFRDKMHNFIYNNILPYIEQLIPSTSIYELIVPLNNSDRNDNTEVAPVNGMVGDSMVKMTSMTEIF